MNTLRAWWRCKTTRKRVVCQTCSPLCGPCPQCGDMVHAPADR